jgi:UDP-N-acetylglucosamine diphosphorylase / glucose-1-phosphate thymidylyltransferase / UDP-N-acetylgalactosamine diphosphorylase / glucosamine-1-phosphate N-acetyltransferase / galactosamine-1-phosphate N-acetyltransferase
MRETGYDVVIFEDSGYANLLPLVYMRAVFELRCGTTTLERRIRAAQGVDKPYWYVRPELALVAAERGEADVLSALSAPRRTLFINGRCLLIEAVETAQGNRVGRNKGRVAYVWADPQLAQRLSAEVFLDDHKLEQMLAGVDSIETNTLLINWPWDLVHNNRRMLEEDWRQSGGEKCLGRVYAGAHLLAQENICIGVGSVVKPGVVLDAEGGPIIIGNHVTIKPNCTLEGPLYIGDATLIQSGAVIREAASIGPVCKVGGEVEGSIIQGYSNKQHDGFLGHSYLGQWVNIGADTITSDLKNTYGSINVPINGREVDSGQIFVGLTMGDHSKTAVNTMFATGSVVGFACNIACSAMPPRFVPSFSWLTDEGIREAIPEKMADIAQRVMDRRKVAMSQAERQLFLQVYQSARLRELRAP